jgi:hypothetical protein
MRGSARLEQIAATLAKLLQVAADNLAGSAADIRDRCDFRGWSLSVIATTMLLLIDWRVDGGEEEGAVSVVDAGGAAVD